MYADCEFSEGGRNFYRIPANGSRYEQKALLAEIIILLQIFDLHYPDCRSISKYRQMNKPLKHYLIQLININLDLLKIK